MKIFWSWQSDHHSKISHYFVRDALKDAIKKLSQPEALEEPSEADRRQNLALDHDTENLTGMPDVAASVFEKIDASAVFIGDVTPIGSSPSKRDKNDQEVGLRPVMNPNVAIELGYALKSRGWANCLAVLNLAYGSVEDLPFDIQQKRWPIRYTLAEGADNKTIREEQEKLAKAFVAALRPFLKQPYPATTTHFEATPAVRPPAFWFEKETVLGKRVDGIEVKMPFEAVMYLRLIPTKELNVLIPHAKLQQVVHPYGGFVDDSGGLSRIITDHGVAMYEPLGEDPRVALSIAHHFHNGEFWGINAEILHYAERGDDRWLFADQLENLYMRKLPNFINCLAQEYGVEFPMRIIAGIVGVQGRVLTEHGGSARGFGKMIKGKVEHEIFLNNSDKKALGTFLFNFFEKIWLGAGIERPIHYNNFPPGPG